MEKISIIIPVYNCEKYIAQCIESVINQTYKSLEIIVINDGSVDSSLEIINDIASYDNRIIVHSQKNKGQSAARNVGIKISTGKYIIFIDSDDWISNNYVELMYKKIIENKSDIVICGHNMYKKNSIKKIRYDILDNFDSKKGYEYLLLGKVSHVCWGKMYLSSIIKDSNFLFPEGLTNEDFYIVSIWFLRSSKLTYLNELVYNVRNRSGSITNTYTEKFLDMFIILEMTEQYIKEMDLFEVHKRNFSIKYQNLVIYLINYGVRFKNINFIKKVLEISRVKRKEINLNFFSSSMKIPVILLYINLDLYYYAMRIYYKISTVFERIQ